MLTVTIQKLIRQGYVIYFDYSPISVRDEMNITISKGRYSVRQCVPNEDLYHAKADADNIVIEILTCMVCKLEKEKK